jgi:hypothetical protein
MCLWVCDQLVWPRRAGGPGPKLDAPPNVRREYEEASQTLEASPRGAAALLRLAIEKLCKELGVSGESLKDDIAFFGCSADYREQRCAPRPNRPWGRSSNGRNLIWSGQLDLRKDDHGAEAPAGSVHKAPRGCSDRNGAAGARQFVIGVAGAVHSPTRGPAQTSPLFQASGSRSPAPRRGCLLNSTTFSSVLRPKDQMA